MGGTHQTVRLIVGCFLAVASLSAARANPVSIRCTGAQDKDPYFVTYDLQTNRFILETPVGNLLKGEIANTADQRLELRLNTMSGPMLLLFHPQTSVVQWPGLPAHEFGRTPLAHICKPTADRTVLSLYSGPHELERRRPVDAFSIRCHGAFLDFFITMDRATQTVVNETEGGLPLSGEISDIKDRKITFAVGTETKKLAPAIWDEETEELSENDPSKPPHSQRCIPEKARSIMELYGRLRE